MDIFSAVAAGVTLGAELLRLSRSLRKMIQKIRYARSEIMKLVEEMAIFADLYEDFYRVCISDQNIKGRTASSARRLVAWTKDAICGFEKLWDRVQVLASRSKNSMIETVAARVKWYFSESEVKCLRSSLSVARESMRGFSNITVIGKLDEEMAILRNAILQGDQPAIAAIEKQLGMTVKDKMEDLTQMRRHRRQQRHAINSRVKEAVEIMEQQSKKTSGSDIVPETQQLLEFTYSVEKYAEKVLPSHSSGNRRRNNANLIVPARQQPIRADSTQPMSSTVSTSFTSNPASFSAPVETTSSETTTEDLSDVLNYCTKRSGTCLRSEEHNSASFPSSLSSVPDLARRSAAGIVEDQPPRYPPKRREIDDDMISNQPMQQKSSSSKHSSHEVRAVLDPQSSSETTEDHAEMIVSERAAIRVEAKSPCNDGLGDEEYESERWNEIEEGLEQEAASSPFHPVAGVRGSFPRGWRTRHERSESPQDFWHRKL